MSEVKGFAESFDTFLEATAEAAIKHVVEAAKGILQTTTIYVVGVIELQYNDEYYYAEGDGSRAKGFFLAENDADDWCRDFTKYAFCTPREKIPDTHMRSECWWDEAALGIQSDSNWEARSEFIANHFSGIANEWEVTFKMLTEKAIEVGDDPMLLVPDLTMVTAINAL